MTNPYLVRDPPNFLTYDAEELEEFLTDETATAEEPHPDEADELSSLCPGLLQPRCDIVASRSTLWNSLDFLFISMPPPISGASRYFRHWLW